MSSGRYRVTITGFTVHSETWDDPFQWDGKRDHNRLQDDDVAYLKVGKVSAGPMSR